MFIIRYLYYKTLARTIHFENIPIGMEQNIEFGNIAIAMEQGIKIYVNFLHGERQYFIRIENIEEYPKNELFDICCSILNTIYEYYGSGCLYRDEIETNDDTVYHMDRLELNKILFNEILDDIVIGKYDDDDDDDRTYIGHISKNNGMYKFKFDKPSEELRYEM
jgi:hypothetical protein